MKTTGKESECIYHVAERAVLCEKLSGGRLCGKYWNASGVVENGRLLPVDRPDLQENSFSFEVNGQETDGYWEAVSLKQKEHNVRLMLRNTLVPVDVEVLTDSGENYFFRRTLKIVNKGKTRAAIGNLKVLSGLLHRSETWNELRADFRSTDFEIGRFIGNSWCAEGRFRWQPLENYTGTVLESDGRFGSSGHAQPWCILRRKDCNEFFTFYFGCSGHWKIGFFCDSTVRKFLSFEIGPASASPQIMLDPGETWTSPAVYANFMRGTLDTVVNAALEYLRNNVIPKCPIKPWPLIGVNSYGARMGALLSEEGVLREIDYMHSLGCEAYTVDCGWFGSRNTDPIARGKIYYYGMGDWIAGPWFPSGLKKISDHLHKRGMRMAVWFEPENVHIASEVANKHPEWFLSEKAGSDRRSFDFSVPEARKYLECTLERCIMEYNIDILRYDAAAERSCVGFTKKDGYMENRTLRHYDFLYSMTDRLRKKFPSLVVENCCGGGGRLDTGILAHTNWTQISDASVYRSAVEIINGISMMLPPELCFIYFNMPFSVGGIGDLDSAWRIRLFTALMNSSTGSLDSTPAAQECDRLYIRLYKEFVRPYLSGGKIYHHTPELRLETPDPEKACTLELDSRDGRHGMIGVFALVDKPDQLRIYPRGLDTAVIYNVRSLARNSEFTASGRELIENGLHVELPCAESSELLLFAPSGKSAE